MGFFRIKAKGSRNRVYTNRHIQEYGLDSTGSGELFNEELLNPFEEGDGKVGPVL